MAQMQQLQLPHSMIPEAPRPAPRSSPKNALLDDMTLRWQMYQLGPETCECVFSADGLGPGNGLPAATSRSPPPRGMATLLDHLGDQKKKKKSIIDAPRENLMRNANQPGSAPAEGPIFDRRYAELNSGDDGGAFSFAGNSIRPKLRLRRARMARRIPGSSASRRPAWSFTPKVIRPHHPGSRALGDLLFSSARSSGNREPAPFAMDIERAGSAKTPPPSGRTDPTRKVNGLRRSAAPRGGVEIRPATMQDTQYHHPPSRGARAPRVRQITAPEDFEIAAA